MRAKDVLGRIGENLAADFLRDSGYVVLERNWRCDVGEIDIVARDASTLIICEVKTRRSLAFGHPLEAVTERKARRLRSLALRWLDEHQVHAPDIRIDVIGVVCQDGARAQITHVRGAL